MVALLRQRCPHCRTGRIFESLLETYDKCPQCSLLFKREEGYYLGAMYFSYALGIAFLGLALLVWHLILPQWDLNWIAALALLSFVPFVPATYRYSRVLWIYFDRWVWPGNEE